MSNVKDPKFSAHQPLSIDEVARAVNRLPPETLDLPRPSRPSQPTYETSALPTMSAVQRFWLAFTGKPGSSGRAGPAYEPGLPRTDPHPDDDAPFGIPHQQGATD